MKAKDFKSIKIPDRPGVYLFKKGREILYVGKATSLKSRVRSYFNRGLAATRGPAIADMVFRSSAINFRVTDSVLEALILEAELIKKLQPKYNIKDKSDSSFNYVVITKEQFPKVLVVRGKNLGDYRGEKFGPYPRGGQLLEAIKIVRKIFPFLDERNKRHLNFYQQLYLAPDLVDRQMYLNNIKNIKLFFRGKKKRILQNLKNEMRNYAKAHQFEKAGEIKRQIFALGHINDVALLKAEPAIAPELLFRIEAYDVAHLSGRDMVGVMAVVEEGRPAKQEYRKFKIRTQSDANDVGALREILGRRFLHTEWRMPNLVVVDGGVAQLRGVSSVISGAGLDIPVAAVVKDTRHKPKAILGEGRVIGRHKPSILLGNSEAHRFATTYHKKARSKSFIKK